MLKKILLASCLLITAMASQASVISHHGYERDSSSNIVKGGGLEWLMWDVTKGMSVNQALAAYADAGWQLATNDMMASLFNTFVFGKDNWSANTNIVQSAQVSWTAGGETHHAELSDHNKFMSLFGLTQELHSGYRANDHYRSASALFLTENSTLGTALLVDDYARDMYQPGYCTGSIFNRRCYNGYWYAQYYAHNAGMWATSASFDTVGSNLGVALVRSLAVEQPSAVPAPATLCLLVLGLFVLATRRQALSR